MDKNESADKLEELVALAQKGDTEAFGEIYEMYVDSIYRFVLIKVGNHSHAQDITAETFKKAWISLPRYARKNFRAYLYAIAKNTTLDFIRKESRITRLSQIQPVVDVKTNLEDNLIKKEEIQRLYAALRQLHEPYAEVITLRFIEELSTKETAKILGKSTVSIRVIQHRALRKLRTLLEQPDQ